MLGPVYVFGPEASGTRYVARNIATALNNGPVLVDGAPWSGMGPECVRTLADAREVQHVSLLSYGGDRLYDLEAPVVQVFDACAHEYHQRVRINATATLEARPDAIAVIIVRRAIYSNLAIFGAGKFSVYHDEAHWDVRKQSLDRDLDIVRDALADHFDRTLLLVYEDMATFYEHNWRRVLAFVGADRNRMALIEPFYDSDVKWIDLCVGRKTFGVIKDEVFPWMIGLTAGVIVGVVVSIGAWGAAALRAKRERKADPAGSQDEEENMVESL